MIHPNREALDLLYYLYFAVREVEDEFDVIGYIEEHHSKSLQEFMEELFADVADRKGLDWEQDDFWVKVIPPAVEDLS